MLCSLVISYRPLVSRVSLGLREPRDCFCGVFGGDTNFGGVHDVAESYGSTSCVDGRLTTYFSYSKLQAKTFC